MKDVRKLTDSELVILVIEKDQELYEELVKRYQDKLLRYANYLLQDEHKSEDAVQEAFVKAYVDLKGFNTKKAFSSWIYRIVHNEAINLIKKEKRLVSLDKNHWLKEIFESSDNVEEDFEKKETAEKVRNSLKKLPVKYRSALTLYYLEEKKYEEISDILRIPVNTVGTRIKRAKEYMAKVYEKGGEK